MASLLGDRRRTSSSSRSTTRRPTTGPRCSTRSPSATRACACTICTERVGRGAARNLALDAAAGDYVWFVETTDRAGSRVARGIARAAPGGVARRAARPPRAHGPARPHPPGPHRRLLARVAEHGPGHARAAAGARGGRAAASGTRCCAREHPARARRRASAPAATASCAVTWPALLAAERIAAVPARRLRPPAARQRGARPLHRGTPFDVFARYDAVFAFLDAARELPARASPARRAGDAAACSSRCSSAVPGARAARVLPAHVGAMAAPPARRRARADGPRRRRCGRARRARRLPRVRAARGVARAAPRAAAPARRGRAGAGAGARARAASRGSSATTARGCAQPIDPDLAVFAAYWYRGYACNPRAIYEKARELVPGMRGVWVVKPDAAATCPRASSTWSPARASTTT